MNALMNVGQQLTMSSREIAELTGKEHRHVMRDIRVMKDQLGDLFVGVDQNWTHPQNGMIYPEMVLDKDTTMCLIAGYDAVVRMRIIKRWKELEGKKDQPIELSRLEILQMAMESEQGRLLALEQRDEAVRTKAEIGSRREATAMATASAKAREVARLKSELGRNQAHATIKAVEKMTKRAFGKQGWRPLRDYCLEHGMVARNVVDEQYGTVKAWPSIAWRDVYGIDLGTVFPDAGEE
jgi:hypothetical protein